MPVELTDAEVGIEPELTDAEVGISPDLSNIKLSQPSIESGANLRDVLDQPAWSPIPPPEVQTPEQWAQTQPAGKLEVLPVEPEGAPAAGAARGLFGAGGSISKALGSLSEMMPLTPPGIPVPIPNITELQRKRMERTPAQLSRDIQNNPFYKAGQVSQDFPDQYLPLSEAEKKSLLTQIPEQATGMAGYVASGPFAPAVIGMEAFTDHIVNDYNEGKKKGLSDDEAGNEAMKKALASGGVQAAVFVALPPLLRKAGDKFLIEKFGQGALAQFFARRAAQTGEVAGIMGTATTGENVVSGRPVMEGVPQAATSGGVLGLVTPRGSPKRKTQPPTELVEPARPATAPGAVTAETAVPADIAKELGGIAGDTFGGLDRYEFPADREGGSRHQVVVPAGSPIEVVREALQKTRDRYNALNVAPTAEPVVPTPPPAATPVAPSTKRPYSGARYRADAAEFERLVQEHGMRNPALEWIRNPDFIALKEGSWKDISSNTELTKAYLRVLDQLGLKTDRATLKAKAEALPKLKAFLEEHARPDDPGNWPEATSTEFLPAEETAPGPKLPPGVNQGDLVDSTQRDTLSLAGERTGDAARIASEKAAAEKSKADAAALAEKQQQDLFNKPAPITPEPKPSAPEKGKGIGGQTFKDLRDKLDRNEGGGRDFTKSLVDAGTYLYEKGMKFADWSGRMVKEFGKNVVPWLKDTWWRLTDSFRTYDVSISKYGRPHIPVQIRDADGKIYDASFNGWQDNRVVGGRLMPSIGRKMPDGGWSHSYLRPGETLLTKVPHPDTWKQLEAAEKTRSAVPITLDREAGAGIPIPKVVQDLAAPGLDAFRSIRDGIKSLLLPSSKGPESLRAAETLAAKLGVMHHSSEAAASQLRPASRAFDKLGVHREGVAPADNRGIKFMSDMSQGRPMKPAAQAISDLIQKLFGERLAALENADAKLETVRDNYFPGMWTRESRRAFNAVMEKQPPGFDLGKATASERAAIKAQVDALIDSGVGSDKDAMMYLTRRPIKGRESFRKQKVFDDIMDAAEFGLRPISNNPIDLVQLKLAEMDKSIMANQYFQTLKERGQLKVIPPGSEVPEGWTKVNDRYGTIYGPPVPGVFGLRIMGYRIIPEAHGEIANNYLSSSLYNNRYFGHLYKAWISTANALNQSQLGMGSPFHAGFTTGEAQISSGANVLKDVYGVLRGNRTVGDLGKSIVNNLTSAVRNPVIGDRVLNAWRNPDGVINPRIAQVVRAAELAGGGFKLETGLQTEQSVKMLRDWYSGSRLKAAGRSPIALTELLAKPTMEFLVPRQKAGVFADLAWRIIDQNPGKSLEDLTPQFRQAWNRVDARLGQVRYDRLFTNNTAKNVVQGFVRAPGWSGGTIAEIGGGFTDAGKFIAEWSKTGKMPENLPDRTAYVLSLLTTVMATNAALTYAFTGQKPTGLDFFVFRTGNKDEQGREERFLIPSYMKDILAYVNHPGQTLVNKAHPLISMITDVAKNKDYYGVEIRNPDESPLKQTGQVAQYVVKGFEPFWTRGTRREVERGASPVSPRTVAPFFGIMPAPRSVTETAAEGLAHELMMQQLPVGARTKEQAERAKAKAEKAPKTDYLVKTVKRLNAPAAVRVWKKANEDERRKIDSEVRSKITRSTSLSYDEKQNLRKQIQIVPQVEELTDAEVGINP